MFTHLWKLHLSLKFTKFTKEHEKKRQQQLFGLLPQVLKLGLSCVANSSIKTVHKKKSSCVANSSIKTVHKKKRRNKIKQMLTSKTNLKFVDKLISRLQTNNRLVDWKRQLLSFSITLDNLIPFGNFFRSCFISNSASDLHSKKKGNTQL